MKGSGNPQNTLKFENIVLCAYQITKNRDLSPIPGSRRGLHMGGREDAGSSFATNKPRWRLQHDQS